MRALIQRVKRANVKVGGDVIGKINQGLLVLLGVEKNDNEEKADKLLNKVLAYRVFADEYEKMNFSLTDVRGGLLVVPQFTLAADTNKGLRPSFSSAAEPTEGERLYTYFIEQAWDKHEKVEVGEFGADMQVELINDGPVTFMLDV